MQKNAGGDGVDFLYGIKNGKSRLASVRFDKKKFTATRARQWLKKHGMSPLEFAAAQEGVQEEDMGTLAEVIKQPSYDQLCRLVRDALDEAYPPQMSEYGYKNSVYHIETLWPDRVLVKVASGIPESATGLGKAKYGLATFTVNNQDNEVELGDLIPASIQAVPTSGDSVVLDEAADGAEKDGNGWLEAGRRNSKGDAGALNQLMRLALSLLGEGDWEEETHGLMKKRLESLKKKMTGKKESVAAAEEAIVEGWQGLPGETLRESFVSPLAEAQIEKTDKEIILRNVFILGPKSANGRHYDESVQQKALPLFEGMKAYLNHPAKNELSEPRKVQDLIGEYKHVRIANGHTVGDMHLINNETVREIVLPIAESKPHLIGNSIVARGISKRNKEGIEVVEEILAVRSADLVAEPATTNQLFAEGRMKEAEMDVKELTIEQLKKERPDLLKEVLESHQSENRLKGLEQENTALKESLAERDGKIAQFELRAAKREKTDQVTKLMREARIPDKVKYTAEGTIKPHFLNLLERCEKDEDMKALLADWEETYQQGTGVISESKELSFGNGEIAPAVYARAIQAVTG